MSHASIIVALDSVVAQSALYSVESIEEAVAYQMEPFDEGGEWFKDGSRWDWWTIGGRYSGKFLGKDIIQRGDLNENALKAFAVKKAADRWARFEEDDSAHKNFLYDISGDETLESLVQEAEKSILTAYGFLKDRKWIEQGRMGWFGAEVQTECEIASGGEWEERCVTKTDDASIYDFTGPKDSEETWRSLFWPRFIRPLPDDTTLVCVDFHV